MSLTILITSNSANNRPIRHDTHTTPARHARRQLAATNTPHKTTFRFPHHAARIHVLKPHAPRLTHHSATRHMRKQHVPRVLNQNRATHTHVITKRAPTSRHSPQVPKRLAADKTTHKTHRHTRISGRTHQGRTIRNSHRPHTHQRIIPRNPTPITNRSRKTSVRRNNRRRLAGNPSGEPATLSGLLLSKPPLTLLHRRKMRNRRTIRTHQPAPARLRATPHHTARRLTPHANMKTSHSKTSHTPHNTKR